MKIFLPLFFFVNITTVSLCQTVSGVITDDKGDPLPYASVVIQGSTHGTSANNEGKYFLHFSKPGQYTLIAQYVGYKRDLRNITLGNSDIELNFKLSLVDFTMEEVIIRSGENPANDIIKKTIAKRPYYEKQLDKFTCEVYTKGIFRLRDYPKKIMGKKVDFGDGDTSKQKILYLSETISSYSVDKPNNTKIEVLSSKVSGNTDGFGLAAPQFYSLYNNNINIGTSLNPRGFISPISDNAMNYYKYKYEGAFFEDGRQINKIRVTPKRKYEPLFSGYIYIVEGEWRIHSVKLMLLKTSQMEFLDTLRLEQIYTPATKDVWVIQSQVIYPTAKIFGVDGYGSFINVYSKFDPNPEFPKKYFNNTILEYKDSSRRKTSEYWDETRPVKLMEEEVMDYKKKDSLEQLSKNPSYLDSIDRKNNKFSIMGFLVTGMDFNKESKRAEYHIKAVSENISYNVVEGLSVVLGGTYTKRLDSSIGRRRLRISPNIRYGFNNHHFNAYVSGNYTFGKKYVNSITVAGGKRPFQFNNASPISVRNNTLSSLFSERNSLKLYEAWYFNASYAKGIGSGFTWSVGIQYQDRMPLDNTTDYTFNNKKDREFTPNYPYEIVNSNIYRHQAFSANLGISWQPGARYIQLPDQKINIGSKWPTMALVYTHGFSGVLGSDVDYGKWKFTLSDIVRFKLTGVFNYRIGAGGFLSSKKVEVIDYQHFNGNISRFATEYLNSFQLLPIYEFSNTSKFYRLAHVEHHFNGFLTNKIPGFRKLNWYLVGGLNNFHVDKTDYLEVFGGFENIFKIMRVDYVFSFRDGQGGRSAIRFGFKRTLARTDD
jgi:hypothetical protein